MDQTNNIEELLMKLIQEGKSIEAIKVYRETNHTTLVEAKEEIDRLRDKVSQQNKALGKEIEQDLIELLKRGKRIEAIKMYCEVTHVSLNDSKKVIDQLNLTLDRSERILTIEDDEQMVIDQFLAHGKKSAIQAYENKYGVYGDEAKDYVNAVLKKTELDQTRRKPKFLNALLVVLTLLLILLILKSVFL